MNNFSQYSFQKNREQNNKIIRNKYISIQYIVFRHKNQIFTILRFTSSQILLYINLFLTNVRDNNILNGIIVIIINIVWHIIISNINVVL